MSLLLVASFGAAGAVSRWALDKWVNGLVAGDFPWGTWAVNLLGAFALGVLIALAVERLPEHPNWRLALGVGFLGSFTTFSTYAWETVNLAERGSPELAFLNAAGMIAVGVACAFAGLALGRAL